MSDGKACTQKASDSVVRVPTSSKDRGSDSVGRVLTHEARCVSQHGGGTSTHAIKAEVYDDVTQDPLAHECVPV